MRMKLIYRCRCFYYLFYLKLGNRVAENGLRITYKVILLTGYILSNDCRIPLCKKVLALVDNTLYHFHRKMYELLLVQRRPSPSWPVLPLSLLILS